MGMKPLTPEQQIQRLKDRFRKVINIVNQREKDRQMNTNLNENDVDR